VNLSARLRRLEHASLTRPARPDCALTPAERLDRLLSLVDEGLGRGGKPPVPAELRGKLLADPEAALAELRTIFLEFKR
jgi:hypothetical protein